MEYQVAEIHRQAYRPRSLVLQSNLNGAQCIMTLDLKKITVYYAPRQYLQGWIGFKTQPPQIHRNLSTRSAARKLLTLGVNFLVALIDYLEGNKVPYLARSLHKLAARTTAALVLLDVCEGGDSGHQKFLRLDSISAYLYYRWLPKGGQPGPFFSEFLLLTLSTFLTRFKPIQTHPVPC